MSLFTAVDDKAKHLQNDNAKSSAGKSLSNYLVYGLIHVCTYSDGEPKKQKSQNQKQPEQQIPDDKARLLEDDMAKLSSAKGSTNEKENDDNHKPGKSTSTQHYLDGNLFCKILTKTFALCSSW